MKTLQKSKTWGLIALLALVLLATACSPSAAEKLNAEGNDAFTQQAYQDALIAYQTAQIKEPELAEPYYNAANALYRQGEYGAALEQLQMALAFADEESLLNNGFFNLGNSSYNSQDLGTAVAAYTESLLLNPDDQDAKYNLELALQQQQQQEQEQEQEQEQQEEESEDGENQEEQQEQEQEQSEDGEGQEEQQEQEQEGEEQSEDGQEGEEEQESEQSEDGQPDEQQEQEQDQGQGQPEEGQPEQEQQQSQVPAPGQRMTEEQAEQLLAAIARDSETLQERLGQIFAVPWRPPVQDW